MSIKKRASEDVVSESVLVEDYSTERSARYNASQNALKTEELYTEVEIRRYDFKKSKIIMIGGPQDTGTSVAKYQLA